MPNRRREPRIKVERAEGFLRGSIPVTVLDVSRSGFKLQLRTSVRTGTVCELRANLDGIRITAQVRIIRCTASGAVADGVGGRAIVYTAGAALVQIDETGGRDLATWLSGLSEVCIAADAELAATPATESEEVRAQASRLIPKLARDVMSTSVFAVRDDTLAERLPELFATRHIAGAPVVDKDGRLVGLVTAQLYFARAARGASAHAAARGKRGKRPKGEASAEPRLLVRDVMSGVSASTISDDATIDEAADAMISRRMNRLLVVNGDRIVGLLDAVDLLELRPRRPAEMFGEAIELLVLD